MQTADIADLNVTSAKLAADAVTSAKILDGTVGTSDLTDLGAYRMQDMQLVEKLSWDVPVNWKVIIDAFNENYHAAHLHAKKRFGVNVLAEHQRAISEYYARPERTHERAEQEAGARFARTAHGTPVLNDALAYFECRLHTVQDAGDHTIFIAEVEDVVLREGQPLLFHRGKYHEIGDPLN